MPFANHSSLANAYLLHSEEMILLLSIGANTTKQRFVNSIKLIVYQSYKAVEYIWIKELKIK